MGELPLGELDLASSRKILRSWERSRDATM
jgi:hypothetical protein